MSVGQTELMMFAHRLRAVACFGVAALASSGCYSSLPVPIDEVRKRALDTPGTQLGGEVLQLESADIDGDGHLDLVAITAEEGANRQLSVHLGDGHGAFAPGQTIVIDGSSVRQQAYDHDIVTGDFDGDGETDVAINVNPGSGTAGFRLRLFRGIDGVLSETTVPAEIGRPHGGVHAQIEELQGKAQSDIAVIHGPRAGSSGAAEVFRLDLQSSGAVRATRGGSTDAIRIRSALALPDDFPGGAQVVYVTVSGHLCWVMAQPFRTRCTTEPQVTSDDGNSLGGDVVGRIDEDMILLRATNAWSLMRFSAGTWTRVERGDLSTGSDDNATIRVGDGYRLVTTSFSDHTIGYRLAALSVDGNELVSTPATTAIIAFDRPGYVGFNHTDLVLPELIESGDFNEDGLDDVVVAGAHEAWLLPGTDDGKLDVPKRLSGPR